MDQYIHAATRHVPRNKGKLVGQKATHAAGTTGQMAFVFQSLPSPGADGGWHIKIAG
jgi:hypothetical protein